MVTSWQTASKPKITLAASSLRRRSIRRRMVSPRSLRHVSDRLLRRASGTEFPVLHLPLRALARWHVGERHHGEPGLTPALEPAAQWVDALETVRRQTEGRQSARRLSGLLAVQDQLAAPRNQVVWMLKRLGREPVRSRDPINAVAESDFYMRGRIHEIKPS